MNWKNLMLHYQNAKLKWKGWRQDCLSSLANRSIWSEISAIYIISILWWVKEFITDHERLIYETERFFLPLSIRLRSIFRPLNVRHLLRKQCLRLRLSTDGWYSWPKVPNLEPDGAECGAIVTFVPMHEGEKARLRRLSKNISIENWFEIFEEKFNSC